MCRKLYQAMRPPSETIEILIMLSEGDVRMLELFAVLYCRDGVVAGGGIHEN